MKNLPVILVAFISFMVSSIGYGAEQAEPNDIRTLDDYFSYATEHNAELAASFEQWRSAAEQIPQAQALPDPKLTYQLETIRNPHGQTFGIMQGFPWFGVIQARTDAASAGEQAARKRYEAQQVKLFSEIKKSYYEYGYLGQQIEIAKQNLELLKHFEEVSRMKYATSQATHPDHIRAEIEIANSDYEVQSLERSMGPIVAKLNSLLNRPSMAVLPIPAKLEFNEIAIDPNKIAAALIQNNPEIQAVRFDMAAARSEIELARKKFYPEIEVGIDALYDSEATMGPGEDPLYAKIGITLPIWTSSYSAGERQAKANLRQINSQKAQLENDLMAEVSQTIYELQNSAKRARLYKNVLIPRAQEMLASYDASYREGSVDFLTLIDAQRTLLKSQLEYQKAVVEYNQSIAQIEGIIGRFLPL